jgi:hypothetical protein
VFLTDFGIAKLLESASPRLTQTDAIMGTPAYISPEQAQANPVDQRSDIYSLGIILYEMVTGSVPFVAETPLAVLFKHISDPLPPPSQVRPDVPASIEQVILKALAKDPNDRFATAGEFVSAWKRALEESEKLQPATEAMTMPPPRPMPGSQPSPKPAPAPKAAFGAGRPAVWIVGCLVGACALFSLVGVALIASNWRGFSSPSPITDIPPITSPTSPPLPTATAGAANIGSVLLSDDFSVSRDGWGTLSNADSSVAYAGEALQVQIFKENWTVWTTPNDMEYDNVHIEVTVNNNGSDPNTAFGIMCAQQSDDWSFYYLVITPSAEYVISRAATGQADVFLTNNNEWGSSSLIPENASSYRLGADCGRGALTLYVNGQQIASATDSAYTTGQIGVFTWSTNKPDSADVTYDDFLVTSLE